MIETMTSREIVKRCVHFAEPPRVGLYFGRFGIDDTVDVFDFFMKDERGMDPWGTIWVVHPDIPSIGIPKEHLINSPDDLPKLRTPDARVFAGMTRQNLEQLTPEQQQKYRFIATSSGIWERIQYIYGMDRVFEAMVDNPEFVHDMIRFCTEFWVAYLRELAPVQDELDAIYMFDDWGTQQDVMISPAMWREFFAEPYRQIVDAAHANGMDFWLHSCGRVTNLIEDFISVGMDLLNNSQSGACGYEYVADHFAGRIAFLTSVDSQSTLTHGTPEQVLAECKRLERWKTDKGGLIAANYVYDAPEENERTVLEYFSGL